MENNKNIRQTMREVPGEKKKFFWVLLVFVLVIGIWIGVQGANQGVLTLATSAQGLTDKDGNIKVRVRAIDAANTSESLYTIDQTAVVKDGQLKLRWQIPPTAKKKAAYIEICAMDKRAGPSSSVKKSCIEQSGDVAYNKVSCPYYVPANSTGFSGQLNGWNKLDDSQKVGCSGDRSFGKVSSLGTLASSQSPGIQVDGGGVLVAENGKIQTKDVEQFVQDALANSGGTVVHVTTNTPAPGTQGPAGANGINGTNGTNGADGAVGIATVSGGGLILSGQNLSLDDSCLGGQILQWDGANWVCASVSGTDSQTLSLVANVLAISGGNSVNLAGYLDNTDSQALSWVGGTRTLSLTGGGSVVISDSDTTYSAGNGLSLGGTTFSINSPTCSGTTKLQWNGTAFTCAADVDTDTTNFNVAANGGAGQNISSGGTVNFTNGTGTTASRSGSDISFGLANTAVTGGTYSASNNANGSLALPQFTVDAQGRLTAASTTNVTLTGISNSQLANSAITVNTAGGLTGGSSVSLGGSINLSLDLSDAGDSATASTSSGSGLEVSGGEIGLIRGCSSNQLLKWNSGSLRWECASDTDTDTNSGGTVTSITAGTGLSGGTITSSGTINIAATGVTAATYGSSTSIPVITVNAQGQITAASSTAIPNANTSTTGLLTSTDWNTFNGKENVLTFTGNGLFSRSGNTVTGLACSAGEIPKWTAGSFVCGTDNNSGTSYSAGNGLSLGGTTFSINSPTCAGTDKLTWSGTAFSCATDVDTDTNTTNFNIAANGGVGQNIAAGNTVNFTNGTGTTASRTGNDISFGLANTAVTSGTYAPSDNGNGSLALPQLTVDSQGRLTAASTTNVTLTGIANSQLTNSSITVNTAGGLTGAATVSLGGTLNLGLDLSDAGDANTATTSSGSGLEVSGGEIGLIRGCSTGELLKYNTTSKQWACAADIDTDTNSGGTVTSITAGTGLSGGTITTSGTIDIANTGVTAATYGSSTSIPVIAVNAQGQITSASSTAIPTASTSTTGLLTSTDWNTFNGKENVLTFTGNGLFSRSGNTITGLACTGSQIAKWSVSAFACGADNDTTYSAGNGLSLGGTTFSVNSPTCSGTDKLTWSGTAFSCAADVDTDTDTTNFNVAAAGTVGSQNISSGGTVTFGNGTGTTATRSGSTVTYGLNNTAVSAGSYAPSDNANGSLALPQLTVDAQGRLTAASTTNVTLTGIANSQLANSAITVNTAGGLTGGASVSLGGSINLSLDLSDAGDANTATTNSGSGLEVSSGEIGLLRGCSTGELLKYNTTSKQWACAADTDTNSGGTVTSITAGTGLSGGTITANGTIDIANTGVTAATYGSSNSIPVIAVNAQGQITSASSTAIPTANTSTTGLLTSTDWNTFNGKENVLTFNGNGLFSRSGNTVTGLACIAGEIPKWSGSAFACGADAGGASYVAGNGLSLGGSTFSINSPTCTGTDKLTWSGTAFSCAADVDTDTDTTNFDIAAAGTVGSQNISSGGTVTFGNGTGTTATRSGSTVTYGLNNTAVSAGTYSPSDNGNGSLALPQITVDAQGRLTAASTTNVTLTGIANSQLTNSSITVNTAGGLTGAATISLGGTLSLGLDLSDAGDVNTATTSSGSGLEVSSGEIGLLRGCSTGELLKYNTTSKQWACAADTDTNSGGTVTSITAGTGLSGGTITTSGTIDIASTGVTAATYGSSTSIPVIAVNAQGQITSASSTAIPTANTSTTGLLTSTDWNTFNGKENVLTFTGNGLFSRSGNTVTGLACTGSQIAKWNVSAFACGTDNDTTYSAGNGLSLGGTTFSINSPTCAGTDKLTWSGTAFSCATDVDTDTDTTNFNVAAAGTVGSQNISSGGTVTFGNGTGTTATRSGSTVTYGLNNTAVTAASYAPSDNANGSLALPQFTVDAQGRLTAASTTNVTLTGIANSQLTNSAITVNTTGPITGGGSVSLGGSLTLNLDLSDAGDTNTATTSSGSGLEVSSGEIGLLRGCSTGELLKYNTTSKQWACSSDIDTNSGGTVTSITAGTGLSGGTITTSGTIDIANTGVTAATYGSSTSIPVIAVNAQGQITSASSTAIPTANTSTTGLLTSTDWNTFNGKENVLTFTGNGLFSRSGNTITGLACTGSQIAKWNVSAFACGTDVDTTYSAGNGLSLGGTTFSINSPTCAGTDKLQWTGTVFVCSADVDTDTGVTSVGTIDSQTKSANGAVISGTSLVLQTADGGNPGLVSTTTQTFAGAKTFSGNVNANGDVTLGDAAADGITITGEIRGASPLAFEGLTNDGVYTTLAITDPTVARTITFPDRSGTVSLSGDTFTGDVTGTLNSSGATALTIAANSVALGTDTTGDYVAGNTAGNGISVTGSAGEGWSPTISINAPTCAGTDKLTWNGSAFSCATDVDTDTTNFNIAANGGAGQNIASGNTVNFVNGTGTTASRSTNDISFSLANTAVSAGTYSPSDNANGSLALPQFTVDAQGRLTAASTTNVTLTGIANSQLTNSGMTVNTAGGLSGGSSVSLGGTINLTLDLSDAGDTNTATTSSGSGLEVSSGEIGLLRGCATNELLKYNSTTKLWACAADVDTNSGGTVTSITAGTGLNGGTITTSGTIDIANTGVTAATYGSSTSIPVIAVNAQGQITSASSTAIPTANTSTTGLLTSTDWNTFNGKENVLTFTGNGLFSRSGNTVTGLACSTGEIPKWTGTFTCGTDIDTDTGVTTVGAFSGSSIANGASISGTTITFGPADATNPGMVTTGTQTFAGAKTFTGATTVSGTGSTSKFRVLDSGGYSVLNVSTSGTGAVTIGAATGNAPTFTVRNNTQNVFVVNSLGGTLVSNLGSYDFQNTTGSTSLLSIDEGTGAVGIGIGPGSAAYPLDVVGDINSSTGYYVGGTAGATTTCSGGQVLQNLVATGGIVTAGTCAADAGVTTIGTIDSQTKSTNGAVISGTSLVLQTADATMPGLVSTGTQTFAGDKTFTGLLTANGGLTLQTGDTFTMNGDAFTDLTGSGLAISSGALIVDDTSATGFFRNGGNTFGAAGTLGTNDGNVLNFETNNTNRFQLSASASTLTGQGATTLTSTGLLALSSASSSDLTLTSGNDLYITAAFSTIVASQYDSNTAFQVQNSLASPLFNVDASTASTTVYSPYDSATAFQVQNSAAGLLFNVDAATQTTTIASPNNSTTAFQVLNGNGAQVININTSANANNLITNSSFEVDDSGWSGGVQNPAVGYVGNASYELNGPATATYSSSLASNSTYNLTFYIKDGGGSYNPQNIDVQYSEDGVTPTSCNPTVATTSGVGWTKVSCNFTTGTVSGSPYISITQTDPYNRTFYIDAVQLVDNTEPTNLVTNPDFESGTTGWGSYSSGTYTQSSNDAHSGTYSLRVVSPTGSQRGVTYSSSFSPSTKYTIKAYAKLDPSSAPSSRRFSLGHVTDNGQTPTSSVGCSIDTPNASEWKLFTCTFTTASSIRFSPYITFTSYDTGSASTIVYLDDVTMYVGDDVANNNPVFQPATISLNGVIDSPAFFRGKDNSDTAFVIQGANTGSSLFTADTINNRIAIGKNIADYTLDVEGVIKASTSVITPNLTSLAATALTIDSGTTGALDIGTGANAKTITIGNATGATSVVVNCGTGACSFGANGVAHTTTIGSATGAATTNIQSGTGNINLQAAGTGTTGRIQVGAGGSGSTTPDLFVLDVKSSSGDPTGTNGAMYYNTNTGKFRCYQNSAWADCITVDTGVTSIGTFTGASIANGASVSGTVLTLGGADATNPGLVSTTTQSFAGNKTFTGNVITNGSLQVDGNTILGDATTDTITAKGSMIANASATATTDTTSGTGTNTTTVTISGTSFANGDVILIDNAGQDYYTRVTAGGGTSSLTVSPAVTFETARTVTKYNIQNIGATDSDYTTQSNRFFQGYFLGGVVTGAGSTTLSDGRLHSTVGLNFDAPNYTFTNTSDSTNAFRVNKANGESLVKFDTSTTDNLITNGNFEANVTGWTAIGSAGTPAQTTAHRYLGSGSMSVATTAAGDGVKYNYALSSQTTYTMSFYVKSSSLTSSTGTVTIGRSEDGSTDTDCGTIGQSISGGGWSKITCSFTTGNVTGTDYIYLKQGDAVAKTLYIDAVELQTSSTLTINPDFETNVSNWNQYGSITTVQNTSESYSGAASMQVDTAADNSTAGPSQTSFTGSIQPNTTYKASYWVKTDAATSGAKTFIIYKRFDNIDAGAGTVCGSASVPVGVWTNVTCTFTTGSVVNVSPFISLNTTDDGVTPITFYMDNVGLAATKYSSNDIGRISLNGAIDSPLTVRGQDSAGALLVQQQNGKTVLGVDTLNGFVGIGTDVPTKTLQVDGKVLIRPTTTDTDTFQVTNTAVPGTANSVIFNVAGATRVVSAGLSTNTSNTTFNVYGTETIKTIANNVNAFRVQDSTGQNVLSVSTSTGNKTVTVGHGTGMDANFRVLNGNGGTSLELMTAGNGSFYSAADNVDFWSGDASQFLFSACGVDGNFAVGNAACNGAYRLDVFGGDVNIESGQVYRIGGVAGASTTCSGGQFLQNQVASGGLTTSGTCANAVTTVGSLGGSIANGASISGNTITFGVADATNPGLVSTSSQTLAGDKTFTGSTTLGDATSDTTTSNGSIVANTATAGVSSGSAVGSQTYNTDTLNVSSALFNNGDIIQVTNSGGTVFFTRVTAGGGTTTLTVSPRVNIDTTFTVTTFNSQNIGATPSNYTSTANRFYQASFLGGVSIDGGNGNTLLSNGQLYSSDAFYFNSGSYVFKNNANSTTAFQVQDSSGITVLGVDSTNKRIFSTVANGVSAVGFTFNTPNYTTSGAKLISLLNNGAEKMYVDKDGNLGIATGAAYAAGASIGTGVTCSGGQILQNQVVVGGITTGGSCVSGSAGVNTVGAFSGTSIANGASISGTTITFGPADASNPGMVSTTVQTFAGAKTFNGAVTLAGTPTITNGLVQSGVVDGASAVGFNFDTPSYTTAGANLLVVANNGTGKFSVDKDGNVLIASGAAYKAGIYTGITGGCTSGQFVSDINAVGGLFISGSCSNAVSSIGTFTGASIANGASMSGNVLTFGAADGTNPGLVSTGTQTFAGDKTLTGLTTLSNSTTTGTVMTITANSLTSGNGLAIGSTSTGLTGNAFSVTSESTAAVTNGIVRYNFTGAHTGNGVQIDDATTTGTVYQINASALTTGTAFQITGPSAANLIRVKNDATQGFNQAQLIVGAGDANNPDALARDQLYVFGRINSSWNQLWADCLANAGTVTAAGSTMYGAAFNRSATAQMTHAGAVSGVSGVCRMSFATPAANATGYFGSNALVTQRSLNPVMEARVLNDSNVDHRSFIGFSDITQTTSVTTDTNQAANEAFFRKQAAGTQWEAVTRTASGTEQITTTVGATNAWHRFRVEMDDTKAEVRFYVDATLVATHTTIPTSSAALGYAIMNNVTSTTSRSLDIDYMRVWSDDPPASVAPAEVASNDGIDGSNQTDDLVSSTPTEDTGNDALLARIKDLELDVTDLKQYKDVLTTETLGDASTKKAVFIADTEFRKQVEFSADALFKANVNVDGTLNANGRVVVSNNTGTITVQSGQTEVQVLFAKPLVGKPNVFLSTEDPDVKVVAQTRTKDGFIIKLSQPITDPLDVQWFAVEKQ